MEHARDHLLEHPQAKRLQLRLGAALIARRIPRLLRLQPLGMHTPC
jgi:hypothetical protein